MFQAKSHWSERIVFYTDIPTQTTTTPPPHPWYVVKWLTFLIFSEFTQYPAMVDLSVCGGVGRSFCCCCQQPYKFSAKLSFPCGYHICMDCCEIHLMSQQQSMNELHCAKCKEVISLKENIRSEYYLSMSHSGWTIELLKHIYVVLTKYFFKTKCLLILKQKLHNKSWRTVFRLLLVVKKVMSNWLAVQKCDLFSKFWYFCLIILRKSLKYDTSLLHLCISVKCVDCRLYIWSYQKDNFLLLNEHQILIPLNTFIDIIMFKFGMKLFILMMSDKCSWLLRIRTYYYNIRHPNTMGYISRFPGNYEIEAVKFSAKYYLGATIAHCSRGI